jgi:ABC-2 type transport system ATP-binding protein
VQFVLAISCESLSRSFGPVRAVDDLSLTVERGSVFALLGANGAGKTTTIHLLLGLLRPDHGRIEVAGLDPIGDGDRVRAKCGALLEHNGIYERLTVAENLEAFGRIARMTANERNARIAGLLGRLGLADRRNARAGTLSRGMKQKLAIARTLLHRPEIVFLDEPTAGLDPEAAVDLRDMIARLARDEGVTAFLNTHNLADAEKLATTIGIMRAGKLLAIGTPSELRSRSTSMVVITAQGLDQAMLDAVHLDPNVLAASLHNGSMTIRLTDDGSAAPIVRALVERGAAIEEVRRNTADLEQAFLTIIRES